MLMGERSGWKVNWELERRYTSDFLTRQESRRAPNRMRKTFASLPGVFVLSLWFVWSVSCIWFVLFVLFILLRRIPRSLLRG